MAWRLDIGVAIRAAAKWSQGMIASLHGGRATHRKRWSLLDKPGPVILKQTSSAALIIIRILPCLPSLRTTGLSYPCISSLARTKPLSRPRVQESSRAFSGPVVIVVVVVTFAIKGMFPQIQCVGAFATTARMSMIYGVMDQRPDSPPTLRKQNGIGADCIERCKVSSTEA